MSTIDIDFCPPTVEEVPPQDAIPSAPIRGRHELGMGVRVGELVAIEDGLVPYVLFPGQPGTAAIPARAVTTLSVRDVGQQVVMCFVDGDPEQPIIMGCLAKERARPLGAAEPEVKVDADGRTVILTAKNEIVLRCGKASITLTRAGKVVISGTYVISRSSGVNRINGGTVEIN